MASALEIATRVRNLVSEKSPAATNITIPHITALIPTALEIWARQAVMDPEKREALEQEFVINVTAGQVDLSNYLNGTTAKILASDLHNSEVFVTTSSGPMVATWLSSYSQFANGRYPLGIPALYFKGNTLRIRNTDGSLSSYDGDDITFIAPAIPISAATIPAEILGDFITFLADYAVREKFVDGR